MVQEIKNKKASKVKNKVVLLLSFTFILVIITGILLLCIEGANSSTGLLHYKAGLMAGVLGSSAYRETMALSNYQEKVSLIGASISCYDGLNRKEINPYKQISDMKSFILTAALLIDKRDSNGTSYKE